MPAQYPDGADPATAGAPRTVLALRVLGVGLLLLVAAAHPNAAKPPLGPRGWAPGDLPVHLGSAAVTAVLVVAYTAGALSVWLTRTAPRSTTWLWACGLGVLALLTSPIGSADHVNYAAYGRITAGGGDPYVEPPLLWAGGADPVTSAVQPPYQLTPSIYGPVATALMTLASLVGGDNLRQTVWVWQVLVVLSWLGVRWLMLRSQVAAPGRVDQLWTLNPVVFGVVVLGAHVDVVASVFAVAACVYAVRSPLLGGVLVGAAAGSKVTYAVAGLGILWSWRALRGRPLAVRCSLLATGFVVVTVAGLVWAGPHVFEQLGRARRQVSLATPWRPVVELLTGPLPSDAVRTLVTVGAVVVFVLLAVALAVVVARPAGAGPGDPVGSALVATFVLTTAYTLSAPYSLPWYDALTWATLPAVAAGALDLVLLVRLWALALAYVPGRVVGMTDHVESLTLGWRRYLAPYVVLLSWAAVAWLALRRRRGAHPAVPGRKGR